MKTIYPKETSKIYDQMAKQKKYRADIERCKKHIKQLRKNLVELSRIKQEVKSCGALTDHIDKAIGDIQTQIGNLAQQSREMGGGDEDN